MNVERKMLRSDAVFVIGCAVAYAVVAFLMPPYISLVEPDSANYINFDSNRTALYPAFLYVCKLIGLGLIQITWLQIVLFSAALGYLLMSLLRAGFPRLLLVLLVAALAGNILFTSFHQSILTESVYFSLGVVATGLWIDYFRTGRVLPLALAGLVLGLMIGVRPVGMALVPMQVIAVLIKRTPHISKWALILIAMVPVGMSVGGERLLYRLVHRAPSQSTAPLLFMGKAAMLIKPNMTFTGPHAQALTAVGAQLLTSFGPWQKILADSPSFPVRVILSAPYEGQAQAQAFLLNELTEAAAQAKTTVDELRVELGKQVILQNLSGYLAQTLLTQVGQWYVNAQRFPPNARMVAAYAEANPAVALDGRITPEMLKPTPSNFALIVYPAFLIAGAVTFVLAFGVLLFIARPALMDSTIGFYLGIAVFLSVMCHAYTLFISLANVWTSRFLMAVFPQLEIIALCLVMIVIHRWKGAKSAARPRPALG